RGADGVVNQLKEVGRGEAVRGVITLDDEAAPLGVGDELLHQPPVGHGSPPVTPPTALAPTPTTAPTLPGTAPPGATPRPPAAPRAHPLPRCPGRGPPRAPWARTWREAPSPAPRRQTRPSPETSSGLSLGTLLRPKLHVVTPQHR